MSTAACEIIGTGDRKLDNTIIKSEGTSSKIIAKDIILEIVDHALDTVNEVTDEEIMDEYPANKFVVNTDHKSGICCTKEKVQPLTGTGDQKSNEAFQPHQEPIIRHPVVEKKNRLTDLVKNSKQVLARIMMSDSKTVLHQQEEKKEEEKVVDVVELDCVQTSDVPFKSRINKILPEEVPFPPDEEENSMEEIGLNNSDNDNNKEIDEEKPAEKKRMTFPRANNGSKAKAAFVAKCRTLKREATNFRKKKWTVGSKIANFFKKKPNEKNAEKETHSNEIFEEDSMN